jgi:gliding motility-associated-like protein
MQYQYESCTATDTVRISVINPDEIECGNVPLPNAFTPNGDGRNDVFFISNPFALEVLQAFEIFDRWGNLMFSTNDVRDAWDGLYRGNAVNPGLYMYKIKYTCQGQDLLKSGSIMLIR